MLPDASERHLETEKEAQNDLELLNRSMIDKVTEIVTNNESASDLWPQFRQVNADYKKRRAEILKPQHQVSESNRKYSWE